MFLRHKRGSHLAEQIAHGNISLYYTRFEDSPHLKFSVLSSFPSTSVPSAHTHTHLHWALLSSSCTDTMSYGGTVVLKASSLFSVSAWVTFTLSLSNSHRSREDRGGLSCSLPCCKTSWHSKERSRLPQAGCN